MIGATFMKFGRAPTTLIIFIVDSETQWSGESSGGRDAGTVPPGESVQEPSELVRTAFVSNRQVVRRDRPIGRTQEVRDFARVHLQGIAQVQASPDQMRRTLPQIPRDLVLSGDPGEAFVNRSAE